ncbi:MAG: YebC/PmpR family DNA-binding transcriptional regulator [Chlamydiia bacterium]|nr:YebC/PmpR family DNA-binding transcriptional regulator [Chlamydiia bacterium]
MAGHSKWETTKRHKAKVDFVRGRNFARLSRIITVAAKDGTEDNPKLRLAVANARACNMPNDNINKAINKAKATAGSGEEITVEFYGSEGVGFIVQADCSNKHQFISSLNVILNKHKSSLAARGSVIHLFNEYEQIKIFKMLTEKDALELSIMLDADDFSMAEDGVLFFIKDSLTKEAIAALEKRFDIISIDRTFLAINTLECSDEGKEENIKILGKLKVIEGVVDVFSNMKI